MLGVTTNVHENVSLKLIHLLLNSSSHDYYFIALVEFVNGTTDKIG